MDGAAAPYIRNFLVNHTSKSFTSTMGSKILISVLTFFAHCSLSSSLILKNRELRT